MDLTYFEDRLNAVSSYVDMPSDRHILLHEYIEQELSGLDDFLLVDTGYWGTCVQYVKSFLGRGSFFQLAGPPGSACWIEDFDENALAFRTERIHHGYSVEGLDRMDGRVVVDELITNKDGFITDYAAILISALEHVYGEIPVGKADKFVKLLF